MAEQGIEKPEKVQKSEVHESMLHLHGPKEVQYNLDELIVLCLVRDGRPYVRSFVEHYLSLGAKHIFLLDNGSTDGTVEVASEYENVTVFQSKLPFKYYQAIMKQYLVERFAQGRWSLSVDIDELFDYPYSDVVELTSFLNYLNERSYTAVVTQMLDMFPEEPLTDAVGTAEDLNKERHKFYDISNVSVHDYSQYKRVGGPNNVLANDEIAVYRDGIKKTIFPNTKPILTKHALIFLDDTIRPMDGSAHKTSNARIADISCVLLHYKFLENLYEFARQAVRQQNYMKDSRKHKLWMETLSREPTLQIKSETSRELRSVNDLVHNQFLIVSRDYMRRVDEEDRNRGVASKSEPGRLIEALFEARAEVGTRQREADIAQQQLQKRIEKLEKGLSKQREEASKSVARAQELRRQVRNLRKQMQDIQNTRTWKLLDRFRRVSAMISRRI